MDESMYFCGVDIAKDAFVVSVKNGRFLTKSRSFAMDRNGFRAFEQIIRVFKENVIVGMEPTGIYHYNLLKFLHKMDYRL